MRIEMDDVSRPQVIALLEEHLRNMYELSPPEHVFAFDASRLRAPEVTFWTAWKDDTLLGCAALKELSPVQGEVKSMRTPASLRRHGAGRALLNHSLQVSREREYQELFLETGRHPAFGPAQTLYRCVGFRECGPFGSYKENGNSVFMSLQLVRDRRARPPQRRRTDDGVFLLQEYAWAEAGVSQARAEAGIRHRLSRTDGRRDLLRVERTRSDDA